ncbi:MAG: FHA domain-containing protein [Limisphaerales bacterium]
MIQLHILSGKKAGATISVSQFPFQVGRTPASSFALDDAGVWEQHFTISWPTVQSLMLIANPKAVTLINGAKVNESALREGDLIEAGAVKMRFGFEPVRQKSLMTREILTWIGLAALSLGQVALIYQLLR